MWCLQNKVFPSPVTDWELELVKTLDRELRQKWKLTETQIEQFKSIPTNKERAEFLRKTNDDT